MSAPEPSIRIAVDPTNPGQFFACCGLLELADRLWQGAEGWFENDGRQFCIAGGGELAELIGSLANTQINSSLSDQELDRLATLLSKEKSKLAQAEVEEKRRLNEMWKRERVYISAPFGLWLDWWRDELGERTELKTWAAKQMVTGMARAMLREVKEAEWSRAPRPEKLFLFVRADCLPFNFDSDLSGQGSSRDAGFSADTLELKSDFRPLLELAAFIGLQRFRPAPAQGDTLRLCLWTTPLQPSVAVAAASGALGPHSGPQYRFRLFDRTKYMKAFLPAQLFREV